MKFRPNSISRKMVFPYMIFIHGIILPPLASGQNAALNPLVYVEEQVDGHGGITGLTEVLNIVLDPTGRHLYAYSRHDSALVVFERDGTSGKLTYIQAVRHEILAEANPYTDQLLQFSPDGKYLYIAVAHPLNDSTRTGTVALFERDAALESVQFIAAYNGGFGVYPYVGVPRALLLSGDGGQLFMLADSPVDFPVNRDDDALVVYRRDPTTGSLTFSQIFVEGVNIPGGLHEVSALSESPDGAYLYVSSAENDALAIFARDTLSGNVTFRRMYTEYYDYFTMTISPDGKHIYTARDFEVMLYTRNVADGSVAFLEKYDSYRTGTRLFPPIRQLLMCPDGAELYGRTEEGVVAFARDTVSGRLSVQFLQGRENYHPPESPVIVAAWMNRPRSFVFEPAGKYLYAANHDNNSILVMARDLTTSVNEITERTQYQGIFQLHPNYPNPFNPTTTIRYALPRDARVSLAVYDLLGRKVATLVDVEQSAGEYSVTWDGRNGNGAMVASGIYIYRLEAGAFVESRKMLLLR